MASTLQMAGCSEPATEIAMDLEKVKQDIEDARQALKVSKDAEEQRELRKYLTALLEKEARLEGTAAGELAACW